MRKLSLINHNLSIETNSFVNLWITFLKSYYLIHPHIFLINIVVYCVFLIVSGLLSTSFIGSSYKFSSLFGFELYSIFSEFHQLYSFLLVASHSALFSLFGLVNDFIHFIYVTSSVINLSIAQTNLAQQSSI